MLKIKKIMIVLFIITLFAPSALIAEESVKPCPYDKYAGEVHLLDDNSSIVTNIDIQHSLTPKTNWNIRIGSVSKTGKTNYVEIAVYYGSSPLDYYGCMMGKGYFYTTAKYNV
ncbi:MAG: hypothetical protein WBO70_03600 [Erysipelotrichaceae bacterium]